MKTNFYFLLICCSFFSFGLKAQCTVVIDSFVVSGLSVNAYATGQGNTFPYYSWYWDDQTPNTNSSENHATHTYAQARGYEVCVTFSDSANQFGCITSDCDSLYVGTVSGTHDLEPLSVSIKIAPNPILNSGTISISLNKPSEVEITLFDLTGNEVEEIDHGRLETGLHFISWNANNLAEGIYFVQIKTGDQVQIKKIIRSSSN